MEEYYLITFSSTHSAISSQKYLEKIIKVVIMPTLREISNSCGISIRVAREDYIKASEQMKKHTVKDYHIYYVQKKEVKQVE